MVQFLELLLFFPAMVVLAATIGWLTYITGVLCMWLIERTNKLLGIK